MKAGNNGRRILLCWEFGRDASHARILKAIGDQLRERRCEVTYAFCAPTAGEAAGIAETDIRPGPSLPFETAPNNSTYVPASGSYSDILTQILVNGEGELDQRLRIWRNIVKDERPDAVIADYAPGLCLACHGDVPIIAIGDGCTLPPTDLASLPTLGGGRQKYKQGDTVVRINQVLAVHVLKPIQRLAEVNRADHYCLLTYPVFDPYRHDRQGPWLGSPLVPQVAQSNAVRSTLLACFDENRQLDLRLLEGLAGSGLAGNAVFSTPIRRTARLLAKANIETPFGSLDLSELPKTRVLVHQGGLEMCCVGALSGIPQVIIYEDLEEKLRAQGLIERGAGFMLEWSTFTAGGLAAAIREAARDETVLNAACILADELAPFAKMQPVDEVVNKVFTLVSEV